jgi:hypothetical protein
MIKWTTGAHRQTENGSHKITEALLKTDFKEKSNILTGQNSLYAELLRKHYKCFENYFIQF